VEVDSTASEGRLWRCNAVGGRRSILRRVPPSCYSVLRRRSRCAQVPAAAPGGRRSRPAYGNVATERDQHVTAAHRPRRQGVSPGGEVGQRRAAQSLYRCSTKWHSDY
jgi:hypothetical protein